MEQSRIDFIKDFYAKCSAICPEYGLNAITAIVAQACNESRYGESALASKYHNYWGMKCGSSYKGKSVNMTTQEEYTAGTKTTIKDNFRAYDSMEEGIKGYCEFITGMKRYKNLIGVTDDTEYITNIKNDGWATDSKYITTVCSIVPTVKSIVEDTPAETPVETTQEEAKGNDTIKTVQDALNQYINAGLAVDGIRGTNTNKAIAKALQYSLNRDYGTGLVVDGVVGTKTLNAIKGKSVRRGNRSYLVTWGEIALMALGYYNSSIEMAGTFGAGMETAVKNFQSANGLTSDAIMGQNTIKKILSVLGII